MIKLVIFDLDGTLINTIADLADSTNYALEQHGFPPHPVKAYRFFVGNGINKLLERALPENERTSENIQLMRNTFLPYYEKHSMDKSVPYPGITQLLNKLQEKNIKLAIASNKYHKATQTLVNHFFPEITFCAVFGQRENTQPKPDPTIVNDILNITGISKLNTLYVGDSCVDMQTSINSGTITCGISWGFRPKAELEQFNPQYIVDKPEEILKILKIC